jgi:5-methylcytosine-specific restriction enzyme B
MAEYFTNDHFNLLNKWKGQRRDESNPEQNRAYEELKKAYEITSAWASALQKKTFPLGRVEVRKRPTSQANTFLPYNWAKIYPAPNSPRELAYTVGIEAGEGFVVKIDTVSLEDGNPVRRAYEGLRGVFDAASPIVRMLSVEEGLSKTLQELVDWSAMAVGQFAFRYDEVAQKLQLGAELNDEEMLVRFDAKPGFKTFRHGWTIFETQLFCKLVRAVHKSGLDWWHETGGVNVRFGRKKPGSERAAAVLGLVRGTRIRTLTWRRPLGSFPKLNREPLTEDLVSQIEAILSIERERLDRELVTEVDRPGLWPDQLTEEQPDPDEPADSVADVVRDVTREAINRIYYGPPGTSKTLRVTNLLKEKYEQPMASIGSEEWRGKAIAEKVAELTWWEASVAALHDLGGKAKVGALLAHDFLKAKVALRGRTSNLQQTVWSSLQEHAIPDSKTVKTQSRREPAVFDKTADSEWYLVGDWKESCAEIVQIVDEIKRGPPSAGSLKNYTFVTFHQSYGYEEFVEGLRPVLSALTAEVKYEIRPGAFKELCRRARASPGQQFAIVIDEINRGNISKIFGELITLIEVDKREGTKNALTVTLPYSGDQFAVPNNIDIIGTMNTADRSLALLDTALRRRFDFIPVLPDSRDEEGAPLSGLRVTIGTHVVNVPKMLTTINQRIEALYDRDHTIGHAYFTSLLDMVDGESRMNRLGEIFRGRIVPLLEEYFFEDWQKIRLVLADHQKPIGAQFVAELGDQEEDLATLFGNDSGLESFATKKRYRVQSESFSNPEAFVRIYQSTVS